MIYRIYCLENSDWTCIINPEIKVDNGKKYLIFKLLKRRYRSSERNEKMKRLDYFAHPFEDGNDIRLIDDVDLPNCLSLESLSTQFIANEEKNDGRYFKDGEHAMKREEKGNKKINNHKTEELLHDTFDFSQL